MNVDFEALSKQLAEAGAVNPLKFDGKVTGSLITIRKKHHEQLSRNAYSLVQGVIEGVCPRSAEHWLAYMNGREIMGSLSCDERELEALFSELSANSFLKRSPIPDVYFMDTYCRTLVNGHNQ